jgi:hypothetical protein
VLLLSRDGATSDEMGLNFLRNEINHFTFSKRIVVDPAGMNPHT